VAWWDNIEHRTRPVADTTNHSTSHSIVPSAIFVANQFFRHDVRRTMYTTGHVATTVAKLSTWFLEQNYDGTEVVYSTNRLQIYYCCGRGWDRHQSGWVKQLNRGGRFRGGITHPRTAHRYCSSTLGLICMISNIL